MVAHVRVKFAYYLTKYCFWQYVEHKVLPQIFKLAQGRRGINVGQLCNERVRRQNHPLHSGAPLWRRKARLGVSVSVRVRCKRRPWRVKRERKGRDAHALRESLPTPLHVAAGDPPDAGASRVGRFNPSPSFAWRVAGDRLPRLKWMPINWNVSICSRVLYQIYAVRTYRSIFSVHTCIF